jgi:hypothetical protein
MMWRQPACLHAVCLQGVQLVLMRRRGVVSACLLLPAGHAACDVGTQLWGCLPACCCPQDVLYVLMDAWWGGSLPACCCLQAVLHVLNGRMVLCDGLHVDCRMDCLC